MQAMVEAGVERGSLAAARRPSNATSVPDLEVRRLTRLFVLAAFVVAALLVLRPAQAHAVATTADRSSATQVTVTMKEFRFVLSTRTVHTGAVTFRLVNRGHLPHDFKIAGKKSALLAPGKKGVLRVVFHRGGAYRYVCTVPGHAQAGMKGVLRVR